MSKNLSKDNDLILHTVNDFFDSTIPRSIITIIIVIMNNNLYSAIKTRVLVGRSRYTGSLGDFPTPRNRFVVRTGRFKFYLLTYLLTFFDLRCHFSENFEGYRMVPFILLTIPVVISYWR